MCFFLQVERDFNLQGSQFTKNCICEQEMTKDEIEVDESGRFLFFK